jgi:hypothetical protein
VDGEAQRVLDALHRVGVAALLLKGPVLAQTLYRRGEIRTYYDIDVLVDPAALPAAGRALAESGYTNISAQRGIDDVAGILHAEAWAAYVEDIGHLMVDLHWQLEGCQVPPEVGWGLLNARRVYLELGGRRVSALDQPGLALHVALHAAQHGPHDLKAMGDLGRALERWPRRTWAQARELADDLRANEAFAAGLRLVPSGAALANELRLPAADALLWGIAHRDARPRGTFHLAAFTNARTLRGRTDLLRRSLFPSRAWISWEYPWSGEHAVRTACAYLLHIARTPLWAIRAWKFTRRSRREGA